VAQHVTAPSVLQLVSAPSTQHLASATPIQQFATTTAAQQLAPPSASQQLATQLAVSRASSPIPAADTTGQEVVPLASVITAPPPPPAPPSLASSAVQGTSSSSTRVPIDEPCVEDSVGEEVPKCHLHRKLNKACKFCKAHAISQDLRSKEADQKKMAALEKLKEGSGPKSSGSSKQDDKVPLPNFNQFPVMLKERILNDRFYKITSINQELSEIKETLFKDCDTCEPELRSQNSLDMTPSEFICSVYRLLTLKLTEGQLQTLLNHRSRWVRCAGFLFVRLGVHQDRYWELLSDALMDSEEFAPFPNRGGESITEGQYAEQLLSREKYCDFKLPRLENAQRRIINERLVFYDQFRKRYDAHVEDLEHLQDPDDKISVEVCNIDGVWVSAETNGPATGVGGRRVTVPVIFPDGVEQSVSLGMVVCPGKKRSSSSSRAQDLICERGRSNEELLQEYRSKQRGNAVASGKDYCKNSGRHMVHAGGVVFMGGDKNKRSRDKDDSDSSEERRGKAKKSVTNRDHEVKMAAIVEKYCARGTTSQARGQSGDGVDGPDRLRLG